VHSFVPVSCTTCGLSSHRVLVVAARKICTKTQHDVRCTRVRPCQTPAWISSVVADKGQLSSRPSTSSIVRPRRRLFRLSCKAHNIAATLNPLASSTADRRKRELDVAIRFSTTTWCSMSMAFVRNNGTPLDLWTRSNKSYKSEQCGQRSTTSSQTAASTASR
jgi:hypothetical protein